MEWKAPSPIEPSIPQLNYPSAHPYVMQPGADRVGDSTLIKTNLALKSLLALFDAYGLNMIVRLYRLHKEINMTPQEQNFVSELMSLSESLLEKLHEINLLTARWNQNGFATEITDGDLGGVSTFQHLTAAKLGNALTAMGTIVTALGTVSDGQQVNLIKMLP